jgi:hypothetical protein
MDINTLKSAFQDELRKIAKMTASPSHWEGDGGVHQVVDMMIGRKPIKALAETEKNAGSMQGAVRSGKRPLSAERYLEKEREDVSKKKATITKLSAKPPSIKGQMIRGGLVLGAGAGLYHLANRANEDRRLGKMIRDQQAQQQQGQ